MGCDFKWSGAIADTGDQEAAVELYATTFGRAGWPRVEPDPARRVSALVLPATYYPLSATGVGERRIDEYAFDFYGIAPFLTRPEYGEGWDMWRRGQLVFDRSNGGRMVTIAPAELDGRYGALAKRGVDVAFADGGFVRLIDYGACARMGLFLNLLRLRLCRDLHAEDDRMYVRRVAQALEHESLRDEARAVDLDAASFGDRFLEAFLWSPDDVETGRKALDPMPGIV